MATGRWARLGAVVAAVLIFGGIVVDPASPKRASATVAPVVSIGDASVVEGATAWRSVRFTVSLSFVASTDVTVDYLTAVGTATAGSDYTAKSGSVTIPTGSMSTFVSVSVHGDTTVEPDETFSVRLANPVGATLGRTVATGRILNDDGSSGLRIAIGNASVAEGTSGSRSVRFTVSLSGRSLSSASVSYATVGGTATSGTDFVAKSGSVTIPAGSTSTSVSVSVLGDTTVETAERFTARLSSPVGATIGRSTGAATILDDDNGAGDNDGDRLPNSAETNTGIFVGVSNTGSDPNNPDTDGDGISDGDEALGTLAGLSLPALGANPLKQNILLEFDWFDDANECGAHSHRPSAAAINGFEAAFSNAPTTNPDGTTGIDVISDYGQGGAFTGGNLIADADGVIAGGVFEPDYLNAKAANFAANRLGYFHYVLMPHRYGTTSTSSGQAEIFGDDLIVSLYCAGSDGNVRNTIMHELGHNLNLRHGGNVDTNYKPNYNSVMNYQYQFPGVDTNCTPPGDGVLDYSRGTRISLDENNLNENLGTCGAGFPWDWNANASVESSVVFNVNSAYDSVFTVLTDYNDWANISFQGIAGAGAGNRAAPPELVTEQPVPFLSRS